MPSPVDGDRLARYADKLDHAEATEVIRAWLSATS